MNTYLILSEDEYDESEISEEEWGRSKEIFGYSIDDALDKYAKFYHSHLYPEWGTDEEIKVKVKDDDKITEYAIILEYWPSFSSYPVEDLNK